MTDATVADRLRREADFHDRWAEGIDVRELLIDEAFESVTAVENQYILERFGDLRGKRVLDYGCGAAEGGIYLAKRGARVVAVDVSPGMLETAQRAAAHHGVQIETRLVKGSGIPADAAEFDCLYGNGVLHHVPLEQTRPELARILKPTGLGCFIEPLPYNPAINLYRRIAKEVRTDDERPVSFPDIDAFETHFGSVEHREFWLTTLSVFGKFYLLDRANPNKERYWKKIYTDAARVAWFFNPLKTLDEWLLAKVPALGRLCWNTVITLAHPRPR